MAKRRYYGYRKKSRYRRKSRRYNVNRRISSMRSPTVGYINNYLLGKSKLIRHTYGISTTISASAGGVGNHCLNLNGLYDPDSTGAGHQPLGFDQMLAFFKHYCVVGCKVTATFIDTSGDGGNHFAALGYSSSPANPFVTTAGAFMQHFIEAKTGRYVDIISDYDKAVLKLNWSLRKLEGITKPSQAIDWTGDSSGNPPQISNAQLYYCNTDESSSASCRIHVQMDFLVLWTDPIILSQS